MQPESPKSPNALLFQSYCTDLHNLQTHILVLLPQLNSFWEQESTFHSNEKTKQFLMQICKEEIYSSESVFVLVCIFNKNKLYLLTF